MLGIYSEAHISPVASQQRCCMLISCIHFSSSPLGILHLLHFFCHLKKKGGKGKKRQLCLVHVLRDPQGQPVPASSPEHGEWLKIRREHETWYITSSFLSGGSFCAQNLRNRGKPWHLVFLSALYPAARPSFLEHQFCHVRPLLGKLLGEV